MPTPHDDLAPTQGALLHTFFRYIIPSTLSLLAISTASVVDGFFMGHFIGSEALAAVNLLIPYFALLFGIALMLAVGGSVKASLAIGKADYTAASNIFSQIFHVVLLINIVVTPLSLFFSDTLFYGLGAPTELFVTMQTYFYILAFAMVVQLCCLVLYYFFRADNQPMLGMQALLLGAFTNIVLDVVFIYGLQWGIAGAAWATLIAQVVQLLFMLRYFYQPKAHLQLHKPIWHIHQVTSSAFNGLSEFINEISIGLVIFVFHWIINIQSGIQGIAAFSAVNYLIFISLMIYYGIVDAMHVLLSQNFGAGNYHRVRAFMIIAAICIATLSLIQVVALHLFQVSLLSLFLENDATTAKNLASFYLIAIWPLFLFNGFNVLTCAYLTSAEKAFHSSFIAILRSLLLPISFALVLYFIFGGHSYIYALPLAEATALVFAILFFIQHTPNKLRNATSR
jgi:putative MATE family efflux protein